MLKLLKLFMKTVHSINIMKILKYDKNKTHRTVFAGVRAITLIFYASFDFFFTGSVTYIIYK